MQIDNKDGGQEVEAVSIPEMPPTSDRRPLDDDKPDGYLESNIDWHHNNDEAVEWLIENHAAIRARLSTQPASTALVESLTSALLKAEEVLANYADPTGYTDGYGDPVPADAVQHEGLLAQEALDIVRSALSASQSTSREEE